MRFSRFLRDIIKLKLEEAGSIGLTELPIYIYICMYVNVSWNEKELSSSNVTDIENSNSFLYKYIYIYIYIHIYIYIFPLNSAIFGFLWDRFGAMIGLSRVLPPGEWGGSFCVFSLRRLFQGLLHPGIDWTSSYRTPRRESRGYTWVIVLVPILWGYTGNRCLCRHIARFLSVYLGNWLPKTLPEAGMYLNFPIGYF